MRDEGLSEPRAHRCVRSTSLSFWKLAGLFSLIQALLVGTCLSILIARHHAPRTLLERVSATITVVLVQPGYAILARTGHNPIYIDSRAIILNSLLWGVSLAFLV